jgi:hypothetical protein
MLAQQMDDNRKSLDEVHLSLTKIRTEDIPGIRVDIATLKVKASLWGATAGSVPVLMMILIQHFWSK